MRGRRQDHGLDLSFLDVVSCGLGAVLLLLVVVQAHEPIRIDLDRKRLETTIAALERESIQLRSEISTLGRELQPLRAQTTEELARVRFVRGELSQADSRRFAALDALAANRAEMGDLRTARQDLSEEMERLLAGYKPLPNDGTVVGVPVDSEYIIFVIDTSTSMTHNAWQAVQRVMDETLRVYPSVQGLQVLNDEGRYLFPAFARQWIPDSPQIRSLILQRMRVWRAFSDSNPAEGIAEAIISFYNGARKASIYVFGDDFPEHSAEALVRYVDRINTPDNSGNRSVRIHGVGFPVHLNRGAFEPASHFANMMRALCERNGGTFVALTSLD